jgi:hypothetical protein
MSNNNYNNNRNGLRDIMPVMVMPNGQLIYWTESGTRGINNGKESSKTPKSQTAKQDKPC